MSQQEEAVGREQRRRADNAGREAKALREELDRLKEAPSVSLLSFRSRHLPSLCLMVLLSWCTVIVPSEFVRTTVPGMHSADAKIVAWDIDVTTMLLAMQTRLQCM